MRNKDAGAVVSSFRIGFLDTSFATSPDESASGGLSCFRV